MARSNNSDGGNNPGKRYEAFGAYYFRVDLHKSGSGKVMGVVPVSQLLGAEVGVGGRRARRGRLQRHDAQADRPHQVSQHRAQAGHVHAELGAVEAAPDVS